MCQAAVAALQILKYVRRNCLQTQWSVADTAGLKFAFGIPSMMSLSLAARTYLRNGKENFFKSLMIDWVVIVCLELRTVGRLED